MKAIILTILGVIVLLVVCWILGGSRVDEIRVLADEKAKEICGENSQIIYQGYERAVIGGFGGRLWYQCDVESVWYQFAITTRIENRIPQVYNFEQMTTFPRDFEIR